MGHIEKPEEIETWLDPDEVFAHASEDAQHDNGIGV